MKILIQNEIAGMRFDMNLKEIADELHNVLCKNSHVDKCSYQHETWEDVGFSKRFWLQRAYSFVNFCDDHNIEVKTGLKLLKHFHQ